MITILEYLGGIYMRTSSVNLAAQGKVHELPSDGPDKKLNFLRKVGQAIQVNGQVNIVLNKVGNNAHSSLFTIDGPFGVYIDGVNELGSGPIPLAKRFGETTEILVNGESITVRLGPKAKNNFARNEARFIVITPKTITVDREESVSERIDDYWERLQSKVT